MIKLNNQLEMKVRIKSSRIVERPDINRIDNINLKERIILLV